MVTSKILLAQPTLSGIIRETASYNNMSIGQTRSILLIGHSDTNFQNTPYQVGSMNDAINWLKADDSSPLLRGLLEAYNNGCRDIWLFSAAPMSEYVSDISDRNTEKVSLGNKTFYEKYYERLTVAYDLLSQYDLFDIVVPIETTFCQSDGIDFTTPLSQFCNDIFTKTSKFVMSVMGTRAIAYTQGLIDEMSSKVSILTELDAPIQDEWDLDLYVEDPRIDFFGEKGKNIMVVVGEGIVISRQMSRTYSANYAVQAASLLATTPLDRSIFGITFPNVAGFAGFELNQAQITQLTESKLNPVLKTQRGKRGQSFQTFLVSDNSLAETGSDFWSINQVRLVAFCVNTIKSYGEAYIGTIAKDSFKQVVYDFFNMLRANGQIKDYTLSVKFTNNIGRAEISVGLTPIFGIRNVYFTVETGPGT